MKDTEQNKLLDFYNAGGGLLPVNERAHDLMDQLSRDEVVSFREVTARDLRFHRCYMSLLSFIYGYMPKSFKDRITKDKFYVYLKHLKGSYEVIFEFEDGTKLVEYESIAFGNMSQKRFESYIREQLPWIYAKVIGKYFDGVIYDNIIQTIEEEYKKFFAKL